MLSPNDFIWSEDDAIFECPSEKSGVDFTVSIDFLEGEATDAEIDEAKRKASENFPKITDKVEAFLSQAYKWLKEEEKLEDLPDEQEFTESFSIEEMCLVDGKHASIYYSGTKSFTDTYITIFLNEELSFEFAEIEEMEE